MAVIASMMSHAQKAIWLSARSPYVLLLSSCCPGRTDEKAAIRVIISHLHVQRHQRLSAVMPARWRVNKLL